MVLWLLVFLPITALLYYVMHVGATFVFVSAALGIIPLAALIGQSTEALAKRLGPTIGGLLNATFGNAPDLIISFFALKAGKLEVVKSSITGAMICNLLFVLGLAVFLGGLRHTTQKFDIKMAASLANMTLIVMIAFLVPAVFDMSEQALGISDELALQGNAHYALAASFVLVGLYVCSIIFSLSGKASAQTGKARKNGKQSSGGFDHALWQLGATLLAAAVAIAWLSDVLVASLDGFTQSFGLSQIFVGLIIIPIISNMAEHSASVFAMKNKIDLAIQLALGSTIQVALLVAPLLVFMSFVLGQPMNLVISRPLELIALVGATLISASVTRDGKTNWLEGAMLLGIYMLVVIAFFFLPESS